MGQISVIAELQKMGWEYQPVSDVEIKTRCPFHDDTDPSVTMNVVKGLFSCKACPASGDFVSFMARVTKQSRGVVWAYLADRYDLESVKTVEPDVIERAHAALWDHKHLLKALYDRGVTDDDVRKYRLGEMDGRVAIPVRNASGVYVNVRKYLPGAPSKEKMRNLSGRGQTRLYPIEQLSYDSIVLCGGEVKAIVAARILNAHGVGAICATVGEGNWDVKLTPRFEGKKVYVMMDVDSAGRQAAEVHCARLKSVAAWVGRVDLPLDRDKHPKGDVNDFVATERGDLWALIQTVEEWHLRAHASHDAPSGEVRDVGLSVALRAENVGRRMRFSGVVSAASERSFQLPRRIEVKCSRNTDYCDKCVVMTRSDNLYTIEAESPAILKMVSAPDHRVDEATRWALGVPRKCPDVTFDILERYDVEDVRVSPSLAISNRDNDKTMQHAVCVQCRADLNGSYKFVGRVYPHPDTQQATLLISDSEAEHDALNDYKPKNLSLLRAFRPDEWTLESLSARLDAIYQDLESNVTTIYLRRNVHVVIDMAYHSPLLVPVDGHETKGWVEVLIVGDSGNGKSKAFRNMMAHYRLGEIAVCKGATPAGLLGGVQKFGNDWFATWGVIPNNDKRLVCLEELKGTQVETIAALTDMRSSGVAEMMKIVKRRTSARTRLPCISNPREERDLASYPFGVEAVRHLIGAPEDVRRFDAAIVTTNDDFTPLALKEIRDNPPVVEQVYTSDLCNALVLWAWTRTLDQVRVEDEARAVINEAAASMGAKYDPSIPIVDRGSMREKLTRLTCAMAARTFSAEPDESGEDDLRLVARRCHAEWVVRFLDAEYSSRGMGYAAYSASRRATSSMTGKREVQAFIENLPFPTEIHERLRDCESFDLTDVQDWCGWDRAEAQTLVSLLTRKRAIRRQGKTQYVKSQEFSDFLRSFSPNGRPEHIPEKREEF